MAMGKRTAKAPGAPRSERDQKFRFLLSLLALLASWRLVLSPACGDEVDSRRLPPAAPQVVDFGRDVRPILEAHCFRCHRGADASSGYRLDRRAEILGEGDGEPLAVVGKSAESLLIHLVSGVRDGEVMPPKGQRLSTAQVGLLRAWIDQGLKWDDTLATEDATPDSHWAFQPVTAPAIPRVQNAGWVRNPIDAFIAARQESDGLSPAPEASRHTLIRRLSFDLTGLPPSPEEIAAFLADEAPDAYERRVERLLASPRHGERWGRHWLDLARWAESEGYESNHPRPYAWRYRDYVVRSFNDDKPFDRFLREQLAGDELLPYSDENLVATGFLAAARLSSNEEDKALQRNDVLVDIVNATGGALLGLTFQCAQCHNHKFDPITARDYYRFQGFFARGQPANLALQDPKLWTAYEAARPPEIEPARKLIDVLFEGARARKMAEAKKTLAPAMLRAVETPPDRRTPEQEALACRADLALQFTPEETEKAIREDDRALYAELKKKRAALEKSLPDKPQTFGFYSPATSPTPVDVLPMKGFYPPPYEPAELARARPFLLVGGDVHNRGPALDAGWPAVFGPTPESIATRASRRTLADWLTDPRHPLTARVWVNRLWAYHFGRGIVATPSDFGRKGAPPSHPELLDWLAGELVRSGWSTKHIHRLIVTSSTYRQAAENSTANAALDPDNLLWGRWSPRRLEAEAIRDAMLAVSGELDTTAGGPGLPDDDSAVRRSLYLTQKRERPPAMQALFDGPSAAAESCPRRYVSTVPLQALHQLNSPFAARRARAFARRVVEWEGNDRARQVEASFLLALGRPPDDTERAAAEAYFRAFAPADDAEEPTGPLVHFCQALLNVNEFLYLE
jgi:mono/diheme cytochrome c family protein